MSTVRPRSHENTSPSPSEIGASTAPAGKFGHLRRWCVRLVMVGVSLLLGLIVAEIALRLCGFSDFKGIAYVIPDAELSHVNMPLADVDVRGADFRYHVRINSDGFRGGELRDNEGPRILMIGDSFTFGQGVDDDETFPMQLQALLDQSGQDDMQVINGGVYAYGALQAKGLAIRTWDITNPDLVVFTHFANDFADDIRHNDGRYASLRNSIPGRRFLRENSAAYNVLKPAALALLSQMGIYDMQLRFEGEGGGSAVSSLDNMWQKGCDLTCDALIELDKFCSEHGARLYVTSVCFTEVSGSLQLSSDAEAVRQRCEAEGIAFLDPRVAFPTKETEPWYNQNMVGHLSPLGNRLFAKSLFVELSRELNLVPMDDVGMSREKQGL